VQVIHIITTIDRGGAEKQLLTLVRQQVRNGKNVTIVYLKGNGELLSDFKDAGAVIDSSLANRHFFLRICKLYLMLRKCHQIVHAHLPEAELVASLTKHRNHLIVSRHNSESFYPKSQILSKMLSRFVEYRATRCIAISAAVKKYLHDSHEWKNPQTIDVVHYGIDCPKSSFRKSPTTSPDITFLCISRLVIQKSIPTLLNSFKIHLKSFPFDKLLIVGSGEQGPQYRKLASNLGIDEKVTWVGRVSNVEHFYQSSDVFVLASKYEGFGLVLLEAMCEQIAILASNASSIPEVLGTSHKGLFHPESDVSLAQFMERARNIEFRKSLIAHQNVRLKEFSPSLMESRIDYQYRIISQEL
jgi:glycosyltransferase involved in cell wall biosynthesis